MSAMSAATRRMLFALVLTAGVLNYVDRQIISVLKPVIAADMHWSDDDYGSLAAWFQGAAAVAFLGTGWLADRLGVKWANAVGVASWSIAATLHGLARGMSAFIAVRVALGATEAMGTPNAVKTIATIFPPEQRSTGFGLSNAVSSVGAIVAPLLIPVFAATWGWRAAFVSAGVAGLVWAAAWLLVTRRISFAREVAVSGPVARPVTAYGAILTDRRTWAIAIAKVLSDATWWLMLFWMPDFLHRQFGLSGTELGGAVAIAYAGSAIGAVGFGGLSTRMLSRGASVNRARKLVMLISGLCVLPVSLALHMGSAAAVVALLALALAGHQGFSTTLFALIADVVPHAKVGRVTAFGAFCGNLGGTAVSKIAGKVLSAGLGYAPLFAVASVAYLLALGWIHLLLPVIAPVEGRRTEGIAMPAH